MSRPRGRPPIYDWEQYADGKEYRLFQGTDFYVAPTSFRALVHRSANARGMKAETVIDKNNKSVSFRFVEG